MFTCIFAWGNSSIITFTRACGTVQAVLLIRENQYEAAIDWHVSQKGRSFFGKVHCLNHKCWHWPGRSWVIPYCVVNMMSLEKMVWRRTGGLMIPKQATWLHLAPYASIFYFVRAPLQHRIIQNVWAWRWTTHSTVTTTDQRGKDMAYLFFIHRVPGRSVREGFSEASFIAGLLWFDLFCGPPVDTLDIDWL